MKKKRVVVAMSGGVDSSVAAAILKEQGYEVIGIMLKLWAEESSSKNKCCTPQAMNDAQEIAELLDIRFYTLDFKNIFYNKIVSHFINIASQGKTPNPCLFCNKIVRFSHLLDKALRLNANWLATGHYAQVKQNSNNSFTLHQAVDLNKDQSYMLSHLNQYQLSHALFPIGSFTKKTVRELASEFKFPIHKKADSQDLCFLGHDGNAGFLSRHGNRYKKAGAIVNKKGEILGQHKGLIHYTIGQRRKLNISWKKPLYVIKKDLQNNFLVVGTNDERGKKELIAGQVSFISGTAPKEQLLVETKIRYKGQKKLSKLMPLNNGYYKIEFEDFISDITAGQGAVFYNKDQVIGGGIIQ